VLFSNDEVARYISKNFEPAWESVRPVPTVTIDFGNGHKITRTLHGNIATYVTTDKGQVLDILPGVYEPTTYLEQLDQFVKLHAMIAQSGERADWALQQYHQRQASLLEAGRPRAVLAEVNRGSSIFGTEQGVKMVLRPESRLAARQASHTAETRAKQQSAPKLDSREDLANWKLLAEDTTINESVRRRQIHEYLAKQLADSKPTRPDDIKKWLYREVLHADLDDPYLGLGKVLFESYPFAKEDAEVKELEAGG